MNRIDHIARYIKWRPKYVGTITLPWIYAEFYIPRWPSPVWSWAVRRIDRFHKRRAATLYGTEAL
jgi:hypothetical protein